MRIPFYNGGEYEQRDGKLSSRLLVGKGMKTVKIVEEINYRRNPKHRCWECEHIFEHGEKFYSVQGHDKGKMSLCSKCITITGLL